MKTKWKKRWWNRANLRNTPLASIQDWAPKFHLRRSASSSVVVIKSMDMAQVRPTLSPHTDFHPSDAYLQCLDIIGEVSPNGSMLVLPYGQSRSNSVESFSSFPSGESFYSSYSSFISAKS